MLIIDPEKKTDGPKLQNFGSSGPVLVKGYLQVCCMLHPTRVNDPNWTKEWIEVTDKQFG